MSELWKVQKEKLKERKRRKRKWKKKDELQEVDVVQTGMTMIMTMMGRKTMQKKA